METMYPPGSHHNGFFATHALRHTMYRNIYLIYAYIYNAYIVYNIYIYYIIILILNYRVMQSAQ